MHTVNTNTPPSPNTVKAVCSYKIHNKQRERLQLCETKESIPQILSEFTNTRLTHADLCTQHPSSDVINCVFTCNYLIQWVTN
jgi:hypothetical protein